ncbi:plasma-membrane proton-efflux P-type ATPase [Candidatus Marsarchaeota archaeon]|nr:plasma-membrane proton-efflux P-type ATPase [Candidatus Marsarchaeota archaeon]MCL5405102.1 plasma-membrane proton-efflux P-type ATPase [Candidatus Marsarchaeota archaeon]
MKEIESQAIENLGIDGAFKKLESSRNGLSNREAERRLQGYGYNEIVEKKPNYFLIFLKKFYGPVQLILIAVIILSYVLHDMKDFYIILALLVFNSFVGFIEEYRADMSVDALKKRLAGSARVLREKEWTVIPARLLVPGDVIKVRLGDIIPADCIVIESESLQVDESVITGESLPQQKLENSVIRQGSIAKKGEAVCLVIGTAYNTVYGKTAKLVQSARVKSHLQNAIMGMVKYLLLGDGIILVVMLAFGLLVLHQPLLIIIKFLLVLLIASVPVALSAAFTVSMALGTERLASRGILVTKLEAIEDTSNMNVLCLDKTGTITKNEIIVRIVRPFGCTAEEVIEYALEASRKEDNDPIDNAIIDYAKINEISSHKQEKFYPFDPSTKRSEATIIQGKLHYYVTKGAVHTVIKMCTVKRKDAGNVRRIVEEFAADGFRTIAVAKSTNNKSWKLCGLIALYDSPRSDAKELIEEIHGLGVRTKMLTGDNIKVAEQIAKEVGMGSRIFDITAGRKNEKQLQKRIISADGFADVYPEDKYTIVKSLQKDGFIVGMTGDGVNDAPALKQSEVGIAVASATDVAKSAAALVLTKDGIEVFVDAVKESRRIFQRMITYSTVKILKTFQIIGFIAIMYLAFRFITILPFMLIILIFTNDIINITISTDNAEYSKNPDIWNVRSLMYSSAIIGIFLVLETMALIPIFKGGLFDLGIPAFQTATFVMFNITNEFSVLNMRAKGFFWKSRPSKPLMLALALGIGVGLVLSYFGIFVPKLSGIEILTIIGLAVAALFINDFVKVAVFRRFKIS